MVGCVVYGVMVFGVWLGVWCDGIVLGVSWVCGVRGMVFIVELVHTYIRICTVHTQ